MGFIILLLGLFNLFFPKAAWYLEIGWKLKDAEPSDGVLILNRVIGIIVCIIGVFYIMGA